MFDTMVITKAVAGVCSALLVFLLGGWLADTIYRPYGPAPQAFIIDLGEVDDVDDLPDEVVDLDALYAEANADAGEALWRQCRACHVMDEGVNGVGPYLHDILGRPIASAAGFNYSGALEQLGEVWTLEALDAFIANPRAAAPGTTMGYNGMRGQQDRINLIAWMERESQ